jgi:hypothetical protein
MQWLSGDITGKALQAMADTLIGDNQVFLRLSHCLDIRDTIIIIRKIRQMEIGGASSVFIRMHYPTKHPPMSTVATANKAISADARCQKCFDAAARPNCCNDHAFTQPLLASFGPFAGQGLQEDDTVEMNRDIAWKSHLGIFLNEVENGDIKKQTLSSKHFGTAKSLDVLSAEIMLKNIQRNYDRRKQGQQQRTTGTAIEKRSATLSKQRFTLRKIACRRSETATGLAESPLPGCQQKSGC